MHESFSGSMIVLGIAAAAAAQDACADPLTYSRTTARSAGAWDVSAGRSKPQARVIVSPEGELIQVSATISRVVFPIL
jgi:hypothetical protein